MKRLMRSWVFWAFAVPAAVVPFFVHHRTEERVISCRCGSRQLETNSRLDLGGNAVYRGASRVTHHHSSKLWDEILQGAHAHAWSVAYRVFRATDGSGFFAAHQKPRLLADVCEEAPEFVAWLKGQCETGAIPPAQVESLVDLGANYVEGDFPFGWKP